MPEDSVSTKVRGMMLGCLDAWVVNIRRGNCGGHGTDLEDWLMGWSQNDTEKLVLSGKYAGLPFKPSSVDSPHVSGPSYML